MCGMVCAAICAGAASAADLGTIAPEFTAAGRRIDVRRRGLYGHHPHGEDPAKTDVIANFFKSPVRETPEAASRRKMKNCAD